MRGVKLDSKKNLIINDKFVDLTNTDKVYIPLFSNNIVCDCKVKVGSRVKIGSVIGTREDIDFNILSSVSGRVVAILKKRIFNNMLVDTVVILNDKKNTYLKYDERINITNYTKDEFCKILKKYSITGMGGGDFPSYIKYTNNNTTLIVNAIECEPYMTSDTCICSKYAKEILDSIDAIMKINNITMAFIAYSSNNIIVESSFLKYISDYPNIYLSKMKDIYPMGWERYAIKSILGFEYKKYPSEVGVVVNNVSTIYSIYEVLKYNRYPSSRVITLAGDGLKSSINILVKKGTLLSDILGKFNNIDISNSKIISSGPMMGTLLDDTDVIVTNNLSGFTFLEKTKEKCNPCIRCSRCIKICPVNLLPIFILNNMSNKDKLKKLHPERCVKCGLCSYVCPSKIGLRDAVKKAISEVEK